MTALKEVWKDISSFERRYRVSNGGYKTIEEAIKKRDELYEKIHYYR